MKKYFNPKKDNWASICERPLFDNTQIKKIVNDVFDNVKFNGDKALIQYTKKFDNIDLKEISFDLERIDISEIDIDPELKESIDNAFNNIYKFHESQLFVSKKIETSKEVFCWQDKRPIENVGLYIPGGTAPLFSSVLMLAIPAMIAKCKKVILCTPPEKNGDINKAILYSAKLCNVNTIINIGGAQAIAAMTLGTKNVPKVNKIFGPGNQYVTSAKLNSIDYNTAIDMPAGPSELLVLADNRANPDYVASDLLSQAEHGPDSQVILVSLCKALIEKVEKSLKNQSKKLDRIDFINQSISNSKLIYFENKQEAVEFINEYAPEHYIINVEDETYFIENLVNAGSVFIGNYTPESAGDYASGTNHTLPTNGNAKQYSGVNLDSFMKTITFQKISKNGLINISKTVETMAEAEGLQAHKNAVTIRINDIKNE
jgi:histidinol dehydrogenase